MAPQHGLLMPWVCVTLLPPLTKRLFITCEEQFKQNFLLLMNSDYINDRNDENYMAFDHTLTLDL